MPVLPSHFSSSLSSFLEKRSIDHTSLLSKRQLFCDEFGYCGNSGWVNWGRWVLLGLIILVFVVSIGLIFTSSRRRVQSGRQPLYGTAWLIPPSYQQSQAQYGFANGPPQYVNQGPYSAPPPPPPEIEHHHHFQSPADGGYNPNLYGVNNNFGYAPPASPPPAFTKM